MGAEEVRRSVAGISTEALEKEIQRRKTAVSEPPAASQDPSFGRVITFVALGIKQIAENGRALKDFEHYLFEEVMNAIYGPEIRVWIRDHWKT